jgi:hypothetical protein
VTAFSNVIIINCAIEQIYLLLFFCYSLAIANVILSFAGAVLPSSLTYYHKDFP